MGVCLFLAAITWIVFGQTVHHDFVNYDDDVYLYENPVVQNGLTAHGLLWAFTLNHSGNPVHPLTWISHMLDCQFYGLNPGGHHLTNVLLHMATVVLLFLVLRTLTTKLWRSAFVAAVFAIHPLRVESVAWVAERKDVLSGLFFMLTIAAYIRYARRPWSRARYGLFVLLFVLGLLCKPMLVTLPLVLLLLDFWPLNRLRNIATSEPAFRLSGWLIPKRPILEKLPLFGLVTISCIATLFAQTEAIQSSEQFSLPLRLGNALVSCVTYLSQMFWPSGLAILYPFPPNGWPLGQIILSFFILVFISALVFLWRKTRPYLLTGWLWYLVMLVPVIGIIQVGVQARADRYTYLPQIGLYLLLVWAVADFCAGWRQRNFILGSLAAIILVPLILCARIQTAYWQNSESLWTHTLACTTDNSLAHYDYGNVLLRMENLDAAIVQYQLALQIKPDYAAAHNSLGSALRKTGNVDEAIVQIQRALQLKPDYADAHNNLGNALLQKGSVDEAIIQFKQALQLKPDNAVICFNLGNTLLEKNDVDEAVAYYKRALALAQAAGQPALAAQIESALKSCTAGLPSP